MRFDPDVICDFQNKFHSLGRYLADFQNSLTLLTASKRTSWEKQFKLRVPVELFPVINAMASDLGPRSAGDRLSAWDMATLVEKGQWASIDDMKRVVATTGQAMTKLRAKIRLRESQAGGQSPLDLTDPANADLMQAYQVNTTALSSPYRWS